MDAQGRVSEVREKVRISQHCSLGLYDFASRDVFMRAYTETYELGPHAQRERYVAPLYQSLLESGDEVFAAEVGADTVVPLGTPEELLAFDPSALPDRAQLSPLSVAG